VKQIPIIFSKNYDITFWGLQHLHPFDSQKYSRIFRYIKKNIAGEQIAFFTPDPITEEDLLLIHTEKYLNSLNDSKIVARIGEMRFLEKIPNAILQKKLLRPMKYASGGTFMGLELAIKNGCAINLSGGYHHAKRDRGSGFSFFSDIAIAIEKTRKKKPNLSVLVIDLDAHQGNGVETIYKDDPNVNIFDLYNENLFPYDFKAREFIAYNFPVRLGIRTKRYLKILTNNIFDSITNSKPDVIIYNAGTDIYKGDLLGRMKISEAGIILRDEIVFKAAIDRGIPILMLLSGGYTKQSAYIIGRSIRNLMVNIIYPVVIN